MHELTGFSWLFAMQGNKLNTSDMTKCDGNPHQLSFQKRSQASQISKSLTIRGLKVLIESVW